MPYLVPFSYNSAHCPSKSFKIDDLQVIWNSICENSYQ